MDRVLDRVGQAMLDLLGDRVERNMYIYGDPDLLGTICLLLLITDIIIFFTGFFRFNLLFVLFFGGWPRHPFSDIIICKLLIKLRDHSLDISHSPTRRPQTKQNNQQRNHPK